MARLGLAIGSALAAYLLALAGTRLYAWQAGIRDLRFRYENQIGMWQPDPQVGFVNKRNFSAYCFGTVRVTTNEHGFRGRRPTPIEKPPGTTRIIGLGDSVMWGSAVNESQSFLGILESKLARHPVGAEVINAGVVGYSALQEYLLFDLFLQGFAPDFLIVNFCQNDKLPSEDPHGMVREAYLDYLHRTVAEQGSTMTASEQKAVQELIDIFHSPHPVHLSVVRATVAAQRMATKLFVEVPVERMARLARARNIHLVYLLIPLRDSNQVYDVLSHKVAQVLDAQGVAYLDLGPALKDDRSGQGRVARRRDNALPWIRQRGEQLLPGLRAIGLLRQQNARHQAQNYIDEMHPSICGNEIIAQRVFEHLKTVGPLAAALRPPLTGP